MVPRPAAFPTRRALLLQALHAAGAVGLRAFLTGVPPALLLRPELALAATDADAARRAPQFVVFATSSNGDPINCNVPGTYADPNLPASAALANVAHADHAAMAATPIALGTQTVLGANVWSTLPPGLLNQACFFHHASGTQVHGDEGEVLKLRGAAVAGEALPVALGRALQAPLGCLRAQPVNFSPDAQAVLTFDSAPQPQYRPATLATLLTAPTGDVGTAALVALRDKTIDDLAAFARARGRAFQARFLDDYAISQTQLRTLQTSLVSRLQAIKGNTLADQLSAAMVLFQTKVTAVVQVQLNMGGDNHDDVGFTRYEVPNHVASMAQLGQLPTLAAAATLTDQVLFAGHNVFGRNLTSDRTRRIGRDHHSGHAVGLLMGKHVRAGVVGGLVTGAAATAAHDYLAGSFDAATGALADDGDVTPATSLASYGKSVMVAAGVPEATAEAQINKGKVVGACLA